MTRPDQNDEPPETRPTGSGERPSAGKPPTPPEPPAPPDDEAERTDIGVAVLLAVAAVIVAIVGGRAALVGDNGSDTWQAAIRQDVKRSAGIVEDARFLYSEEVPQALQVEEAEIRGRELRRVSREESGTVRGILEAQSKAQKEVAEPIDNANDLAGNPRYDLAEDGVVRRLADARAKNPDLTRLDPDTTEGRGSSLTLQSTWLISATVIVAIAFLLGALAEGFGSWRRRLLPVGFAFAGVGLLAAVVVEVVF